MSHHQSQGMGWVTPVNGIKTHGEIHTIKSCQTFILFLTQLPYMCMLNIL